MCVFFPPFHCVKLGYAEFKTLHWEVTHIVMCVCVLCVTGLLSRNVTPCDCVTPPVAASLTTVGQLPLTGDRVFQLICSERIWALHVAPTFNIQVCNRAAPPWAGCSLSVTVKVTIRESEGVGRRSCSYRPRKSYLINYLAPTFSFLSVWRNSQQPLPADLMRISTSNKIYSFQKTDDM